MARRSAIVIAAAFLTVLIVPAIPAAAGGGCHTGATQGTGDTVELVDACPTPTILTIDSGGTVTFVNEDPFAHNVIGRPGVIPTTSTRMQAFTATFDEPGVYPWACWYHPGHDRCDRRRRRDRRRQRRVRDGLLVPQPEPSPVVEVRTVTGRRARHGCGMGHRSPCSASGSGPRPRRSPAA